MLPIIELSFIHALVWIISTQLCAYCIYSQEYFPEYIFGNSKFKYSIGIYSGKLCFRKCQVYNVYIFKIREILHKAQKNFKYEQYVLIVMYIHLYIYLLFPLPQKLQILLKQHLLLYFFPCIASDLERLNDWFSSSLPFYSFLLLWLINVSQRLTNKVENILALYYAFSIATTQFCHQKFATKPGVWQNWGRLMTTEQCSFPIWKLQIFYILLSSVHLMHISASIWLAFLTLLKSFVVVTFFICRPCCWKLHDTCSLGIGKWLYWLLTQPLRYYSHVLPF